MKTVAHVYRFEASKPAEARAWDALRAKLKASHPHCMESFPLGGGESYYATGLKLQGAPVELDPAHLFNNQWNTTPRAGNNGLRVFDWALDVLYDSNGKRSAWRQGYYLEQTDEMREIRRNTVACRYCGAKEPAAKEYTFCPHCIGNEYLKPDDLKLTRMRPIQDTGPGRAIPELTAAEREHLMPLYRAAQLQGRTASDKKRIAAARQRIESEYTKTVANATEKRVAARWVMDNCPGQLDNWIFYSHTGKHCFGWRQPLSAEVLSELLELISEFPFAYDIKCADGRTLSGY